MPETAAFIDACREAFGQAGIDAAIRAGLRGVAGFYAREGGLEVGTQEKPAAQFEVVNADRWQRVGF